MKAIVYWQDGTSTEMKAEKVNGRIMVGGDHSRAITELGATIYVVSKGKIYLLKGNRLIFQDNEG